MWVKVFVWFPMLVEGRLVWLSYVERKRVVHFHIGGIFNEDEYRRNT